MLQAWIENAHSRKIELTLEGQYCGWIYESRRDRHYRYRNEATIPLVVEERVENLVLDRINMLDEGTSNMYASYVPSVSRTTLLSASGMGEAITFDPAQVRPIRIAYSASPVDGPMLLLPGASAPAVRALRANLLQQAEQVDLTGPEMVVMLSDD